MNLKVRISCLFSLLCATLSAQDSLLPLPEGGLDYAPLDTPAETVFLKPTKSIKPPMPSATTAAVTAKPQVNTPTSVRLRKVILMPGGLSPESMREQMVASGQNRKPVTVVGMDAPAPVISNLANFFGSDVNPATQKQLLDSVSQGMGNKTSKAPRRVEMVGWLPTEGIMAVAVYPES